MQLCIYSCYMNIKGTIAASPLASGCKGRCNRLLRAMQLVALKQAVKACLHQKACGNPVWLPEPPTLPAQTSIDSKPWE